MTPLESIVLPLAESRALVEHKIVLDTAMVWVGLWGMDAHWHIEGREQIEMQRAYPELDRVENGATVEERGLVIVAAPVLSELLDAIRAKVGGNETTAILSRDKSEAGASCAGIRTEGGEYEIAPAPTDLLAAAALLMEVSK